MNHQTSFVPQVAYQSPQAPTQPMTELPLVDSGFVVPVFSPGDDSIACLNKAMDFLTAVTSLRFHSTNNQLRISSNLRNQATIQDGRVTERVVKFYNCQGEGHMARLCTQLKRPRNAAWHKEKAILAEAQEAGQILDEEQLAFLADPGFQLVKLFRQSFQIMLLSRLRILILMILTLMISQMHERFSWPTFLTMVLTLSQRKRFVPQHALSADETIWYHMLNPSTKYSDALPCKTEAPKELPKVSLVNENLKNLKLHLANVDKVVKIRTTPNARIEGEWEFEHTKDVFNNEINPF
nr:hypothetical protein [Tanacetum cinerariifolium]